MNYTSLGTTGPTVSELCLGSLIYGTLQARMTPRESEGAIRTALDDGVNFIDTAKTYGVYDHIRLAVKSSDNVVITSKSPVKTYAEMYRDVTDGLIALGREKIEIFLLHVVRHEKDMADRAGALEALVRCREEGLIDHIGLSAHSVAGTRCALSSDDIEIVMPILNKKGLGIPDGDGAEMLAVCREIKATGRGLYDMKALAGGHLIDDIPGALSYVRDLDVFDSIAVGMRTPEEVEAIAGLFNDTPGAADRALSMGRERAGTKQLIIYDFLCEGCGTCIDACAQDALSMKDGAPVVDSGSCILCGYCGEACPKFAIRVI